MTDDTESPLTEQELEAVRSDREGLQFEAEAAREGALESVAPTGPPSRRGISDGAFDLIVEFEVSSKQVYISKYRKPVWPQGASGVTIGIGYDVGYATRNQLHADFDGAIPDEMVSALEAALGVTGAPAKDLARRLGAEVDVPWDAAITVHRSKVMPRWIGLTERSLAHTDALSDDSLGALVSLTYNRGAAFRKAGDRCREMRDIKSNMDTKNFAAIPADFRSMKRLWPDVLGLQKRREREARLFEQGLATS